MSHSLIDRVPTTTFNTIFDVITFNDSGITTYINTFKHFLHIRPNIRNLTTNGLIVSSGIGNT